MTEIPEPLPPDLTRRPDPTESTVPSQNMDFDGSDRTLDVAKDEAPTVAADVKGGAQEVASTTKEQATEVTQEAKVQARAPHDQTKGERGQQATDQQARAASGLSALGDELRTVADRSDGGIASDLAKQAANRIRIVIADDHDLYRRGMQAVLGIEPDLKIVAEASSGGEAVEKCFEFDPDVVLLDVRMPSNSGIEACAAIKEKAPRTKILILTAYDDEADLFAAIRAGASGYLLKDLPSEQIAESVRLAHSGQSMIPPHMASQLIAEFSRLSNEPPTEATAGPRLTGRELEVLALVARGKANKEIATQLFISENTVKNHMRNILEKLQLHSRVEAALYAIRHNLIELSD